MDWNHSFILPKHAAFDYLKGCMDEGMWYSHYGIMQSASFKCYFRSSGGWFTRSQASKTNFCKLICLCGFGAMVEASLSSSGMTFDYI